MKGKIVPLRTKETLAQIIESRITELAPVKTQTDIADEMGFPSTNFMAMIKRGRSKLALKRIEDLARALDMDFKYLFQAALRQYYDEDVIALMERSFSNLTTQAEDDVLALAKRHLPVSGSLGSETRRRLVEVLKEAKSED